MFGAVVGAFASFTGAVISGSDPRSAALWGAAGGFVGGGISGGLQARALGRPLLTGKEPSLAPAPLSGSIGEVAIRGGGQNSIPQSLDEVLPSQADELADVSIGPAKFAFVGLKNGGTAISTFHIKSARELARLVSWINY